MSTPKEGNLEAPTRHPIDWKNPEYYNREKLNEELERVFDICHGCRRCHSLCDAFPTLFDLVDESDTMEMDGVDKADYIKVVDQCYLCDMCYVAKCPYVPPHPFNLDFPHLMLQAKAVDTKEKGLAFRDKFLSDTDGTGKLAGIPVITETINAVNQWTPTRKVLEAVLGVDVEAWIPPLASKKLRDKVTPNSVEPVNGERTPGKVGLFATCYVNYNEPGIGEDLIAVLEHNEIAWTFAEKEVCCGMPKLEQGDLEGVEALKRINIPRLAALAREGYALMSAVPSCTLMFKQELPLLFPDDAEVQLVKEAFWDPFEYLIARQKDGLLKGELKHGLGKVSYHVPCHGRVQNIGKKTEELLKQIPDTEINTVERCSGHAGTYGVKKEFHEHAMKIGRPVFRQMSSTQPDYISSDCPLGGAHIAQGIEKNHQQTPQKAHPISLVRKAYGI
ncbi:MAG TPA: heterodisulfide reductase-related iron-sulfur binding cluster [Pseudomonadales bacterium]|nr:heterodisulfide reductase-related iron-sulfur binding cluster [Pseudomonadales bacterium]